MTGWRRATLFAGGFGLYAGVLLTGMALPLWPATAIGLAAFLSYTALMRPKAQWALNPVMVALTLLVLGLLSLGLTALGGVLGGWMRPPDYLGPVLAFGGVLVARLAWSAQKAAAMDQFLNGAISQLAEISDSVSAEFADSPDQPALSEAAARYVGSLPDLLAALPDAGQDPAARAAHLDQLIAPLRKEWSDVLPLLVTANRPEMTETGAWLLLSPGILPSAFGLFEAFMVESALTELSPAVSELVAARALSVDLDESECWRILPSASALNSRAADLGHPPALTALAGLIAAREAEAEANAAAG